MFSDATDTRTYQTANDGSVITHYAFGANAASLQASSGGILSKVVAAVANAPMCTIEITKAAIANAYFNGQNGLTGVFGTSAPYSVTGVKLTRSSSSSNDWTSVPADLDLVFEDENGDSQGTASGLKVIPEFVVNDAIQTNEYSAAGCVGEFEESAYSSPALIQAFRVFADGSQQEIKAGDLALTSDPSVLFSATNPADSTQEIEIDDPLSLLYFPPSGANPFVVDDRHGLPTAQLTAAPVFAFGTTEVTSFAFTYRSPPGVGSVSAYFLAPPSLDAVVTKSVPVGVLTLNVMYDIGVARTTDGKPTKPIPLVGTILLPEGFSAASVSALVTPESGAISAPIPLTIDDNGTLSGSIPATTYIGTGQKFGVTAIAVLTNGNTVTSSPSLTPILSAILQLRAVGGSFQDALSFSFVTHTLQKQSGGAAALATAQNFEAQLQLPNEDVASFSLRVVAAPVPR